MAEQQPYPFKTPFPDLIVRRPNVIYEEIAGRVRAGDIYTKKEIMDALERGGMTNPRETDLRRYIEDGRFFLATGVALHFKNVETPVGDVTLYYDWDRQESEEFDHSQELAIQRGEQQLRDLMIARTQRRAQRT